MSVSWTLRIAGSVTLAGFYFVSPPLSSGAAWGQYLTRSEFARSRAVPNARFRKDETSRPPAFALQPAPAQPAAPAVGPVTIPPVDTNSALGSALAACDKLSDGFEPADLPGAKGDIKLDHCYRGRDHLVCSFNALLTEAKSLLENYRRIADANYPDLGSLDAICRIGANTIPTDLQSATEFNARFKSLKAQYEARLNCASSVRESLRGVTLLDMANAPDLLKSMIDTIEGDVKGVSDIQAQVVSLSEKIDTSQKAINSMQKVHRAMCAKNQIMGPENRVAR